MTDGLRLLWRGRESSLLGDYLHVPKVARLINAAAQRHHEAPYDCKCDVADQQPRCRSANCPVAYIQALTSDPSAAGIAPIYWWAAT